MRRLLLASTALSLIAPSLSFAAEDGATMLGPLMVESESGETLQQDGYVAIQGQQATKVDAPIARIPQAVSTVTQAQMEDQKPRTLNEAISYSAGVDTGTFGFDTRYDAFKLRGFPAHYTGMFRDGLRQYNGPSAWFRNDPYTVEGIAILKGPASSLYGVSGPGGLVNLVTKRPKDQPFHEIELLGGTDDRRQAAFDLSGPVDDEGRVLYRLTGLARASDTTLDGYPDDKTLIAPAATIRFDKAGPYRYSIIAWRDLYATWRDEAKKKRDGKKRSGQGEEGGRRHSGGGNTNGRVPPPFHPTQDCGGPEFLNFFI